MGGVVLSPFLPFPPLVVLDGMLLALTHQSSLRARATFSWPTLYIYIYIYIYILPSPALFSIQLIYLLFDTVEFDFTVFVSVMIIQKEFPRAV